MQAWESNWVIWHHFSKVKMILILVIQGITVQKKALAKKGQEILI
jgi:hypothetical protein